MVAATTILLKKHFRLPKIKHCFATLAHFDIEIVAWYRLRRPFWHFPKGTIRNTSGLVPLVDVIVLAEGRLVNGFCATGPIQVFCNECVLSPTKPLPVRVVVARKSLAPGKYEIKFMLVTQIVGMKHLLPKVVWC
jgi:hypothetical protein